MEFILPKYNLHLNENVLQIFYNYIQKKHDAKEAGGVLTGKIYHELIKILNCSEPTCLDYRSKYNFNRSHNSAQIFINKMFHESNGEEIYLGEWHTHPEDIPTPSQLDITSFIKTVSKNKLNSNVHYMIIIGRTKSYLGVYTNGVKTHEINFDNIKL
ncbi:hypothetical protein ES711_10785 [Gelidibacter salicanalis]|uniref:JAB domain-containing protein n=1 Tax=Gelidibacter salicanalis TaxID=291193 RepID=A0A5C7AHZ1_9FLAO|nr:Mov34/MPN/PAD-1 family protein [Gelidibacter salicanalis]TXE07907.1 hypothetical protein ES711_10785 [Gelidibacter salicanalis]